MRFHFSTAETRRPTALISFRIPLLLVVLGLGLLPGCAGGRAVTRSAQDRAGSAAARRPAFRPGQGRLVGIGWSDASPQGVRERASTLRRSAIEALAPQDRRTLGPLRADAVLALIAGNFDQAIETLSRATESAPRNAIVATDLAAARLQRGVALGDPHDFVLALYAANRALHLGPTLPAARFNQALALQRLSLYPQAREQWRLYLAIETDPAGSQAARAHLADLEKKARRPTAPKSRLEALERAVERADRGQIRALVAASPRDLREHVDEHLLPDWAEAEARQHTAEAGRLLAIARAIGEALVAVNGERMAADTVAQIDGLRRTSPAGLARLVEGFREHGRGLSPAQRGNFSEALPHFEAARRRLLAERSPSAGWSTFWAALCRYQSDDYAAALGLLRPLAQSSHGRRYAALQGRAAWLVGLMTIVQGDPVASREAFGTALAAFRPLGETVYATRMAGYLALGLDYLGRRDEAWRQIYSSLVEPATFEEPATRLSLCDTASWLAKADGEEEVALWFQDEAVRIVLDSGQAYAIVPALRGRSEVRVARGEHDLAAADLVSARRYLGQIPDEKLRQSLDAELKLVEAELADTPQEKAARLDDVIRGFRASSYHFRLGQALFERARARDVLGRTDEAEEDLKAAIAELERANEKIALEERISYFDRSREILDFMIGFQMERRRRSEAAFTYSEQAKARVLLDWIRAHPAAASAPADAGPPAADPRSLRRQLPPGTVVLEYSVLPRSLAIWVLRQDGFAAETVAVSAGSLADLVEKLTHALHGNRQEDFLAASSRLYDLLVRPVAGRLVPADRIVFVPDAALHALPFGLLRDGRSGRYLIEDHVGSVAPSARVLVANLRRQAELAKQGAPRVLAFVDPAFDRRLFPGLSRLTSRGGAAIAAAFPGSRVLGDRTATRDAFLREARGFEILHFGGHSLVNDDYPLLSQMLFAAEPGDPAHGVLYSGQLLTSRFERTRLAVLASCSTAAGRISRTEGVESLARPFLAAGVPAVVASLWDVGDQATAELFSRFYRHLRESGDPAAALQRTQVESLRRGADPAAWGAFELIGSNAALR